MSGVTRRRVYSPAPAPDAVPSPATSRATTESDAPPERAAETKAGKATCERVTFYVPREAIEYLDDLLYLARKRGETGIRDRTQIVRALVEAFRRSGHGLGNCATEEEIVQSFTAKLQR